MEGGNTRPPNPYIMPETKTYFTSIYPSTISTTDVGWILFLDSFMLLAEWELECNQGWHYGCYKQYGRSVKGQGIQPG